MAYGAAAEVLGIAAFALVTLGLVLVFVPAPGPAQVFVLTYVTASLCTLAAASVSRLFLATDGTGTGPWLLDGAAAHFLHRWLVGLAGFASFAWLTAALLILSGVPLEVHLALVLAIGTLTAGLVITMIVRSRPFLDPVTTGLARSWRFFAILYVVMIWAMWAESILARRPSAIWAAIARIVLVAAPCRSRTDCPRWVSARSRARTRAPVPAATPTRCGMLSGRRSGLPRSC